MNNPVHNQKWRLALLENLVQVLRINVCIVDATGHPVATPAPNPFGWKLLADTSGGITSRFNPLEGGELEFIDEFQLHHFAIPVKSPSNEISGYIILGPVILNKKLEKAKYEEFAGLSNRNLKNVLDDLEGIRVISYTSLRYILDLIQEFTGLVHNILKPIQAVPIQKVGPDRIRDILQSILELSLGITSAQSGSIMILDLKTNELFIHAAKGLDERYLRKPLKLNEGIAGLAFQENKTLILTDKDSHNRIRHLLNRKEIKQSIVMPFEGADGKIRGLLNLNIMDKALIKEDSQIPETLSRITMAALQAL